LVILMAIGLVACSSPDQSSTPPAKKPVPVSTPTATTAQPFIKFVAEPGWRSVVEKHDVNHATLNVTTIKDLAIIPAQSDVIVQAQCRGDGTVLLYLQALTSSQPYATVPVSCKTAEPTVLDYGRKTFPKGEKDAAIISVSGTVEWQAIVEVPN
jgi:hypothetical protein